jgi:hypothetical protein
MLALWDLFCQIHYSTNLRNNVSLQILAAGVSCKSKKVSGLVSDVEAKLDSAVVAMFSQPKNFSVNCFVCFNVKCFLVFSGV